MPNETESDLPDGPPPRVLLIEDNRSLAANVGEFLAAAGWAVDYAQDGAAGLQLATSVSFEVIVLDLALPKIDGIDLCGRLRAEHGITTPVLMLTARDSLPDKLQGFAAGADDYLTKPFALAELRVRMTAMLRRQINRGHRLQLADLVFDTRTREVTRAGRAVHLSPTAARLLECLLRRAPDIVSRRDLTYLLWGEDPPRGEAALRVHVHALRAAIDKPHAASLLHTVPGVGYALRTDAS